MSPRVIHIPLSGRDRRHYAAELRKGEDAYKRFTQEAKAAHASADRQLAEAHRLDCEAWSALQFIGGDDAPSPLIADAIRGGCDQLEVQCRTCNHTRMIDLTLAIWPRGNQVHTLRRVLYCEHCLKEHGKKRRPGLIGLRQRPDPEPPAPAAAKRKGAR
jgi:hypothetical protein